MLALDAQNSHIARISVIQDDVEGLDDLEEEGLVRDDLRAQQLLPDDLPLLNHLLSILNPAEEDAQVKVQSLD